MLLKRLPNIQSFTIFLIISAGKDLWTITITCVCNISYSKLTEVSCWANHWRTQCLALLLSGPIKISFFLRHRMQRCQWGVLQRWQDIITPRILLGKLRFQKKNLKALLISIMPNCCGKYFSERVCQSAEDYLPHLAQFRSVVWISGGPIRGINCASPNFFLKGVIWKCRKDLIGLFTDAHRCPGGSGVLISPFIPNDKYIAIWMKSKPEMPFFKYAYNRNLHVSDYII